MVAPSYRTGTFPSFSEYMRKANAANSKNLWKTLVEKLMDLLPAGNPLWISTGGGVVAWPYLRIDYVSAKYYSHIPYTSYIQRSKKTSIGKIMSIISPFCNTVVDVI